MYWLGLDVYNGRMSRLLVLLLALIACAWAAPADMLVSTDWLAARLNDPAVVVLHVGSEQDYRAGHVPGARLVTLGDLSVTGDRGLRLELPPVEALRAALMKLGVGDGSRVVIYPAGESVQSATRVWFTFDYLGLGERASLLDGGLAAWRAEGRPVSTEIPRVEPAANLTARARPEIVVDAEYVRSHAGAIDLIDARTPEFYSGESAGMMPRAGHIPGARNVPFVTLVDERRKLKSHEALAALPGEAGKPAVAYCHIGQQATVVYFVSRYLGREVRLYDGSFQDWSTRPGLPVSK